MAERKAQFAALPLRAIRDGRLTDRDVRILAAIAAHDRMSSVRGKGQGAWASHKTMAAEVGEGADYARFSVSVNKLVDLGYLQRDRLESDRRKHTYRVLYTAGDHLPHGKPPEPQKVCSTANHLADDSLPESDDQAEIVCSAPQLSRGNETETRSQYISLSEERAPSKDGAYSAEASIDSAEAARLEARGSAGEDDLNTGASLAMIERRLRDDALAPRHRETAREFLMSVIENEQVIELVYWAQRLVEKLPPPPVEAPPSNVIPISVGKERLS